MCLRCKLQASFSHFFFKKSSIFGSDIIFLSLREHLFGNVLCFFRKIPKLILLNFHDPDCSHFGNLLFFFLVKFHHELFLNLVHLLEMTLNCANFGAMNAEFVLLGASKTIFLAAEGRAWMRTVLAGAQKFGFVALRASSFWISYFIFLLHI
jgi:hypothetical protein